ncbi:DUF6049 family protein [Cryobacterium tagatosivorans]|uniref:Uncharacterized protein n=1 Tax=Cryobacterium tagatosivorans TaxID=1259199 RepID=A0A4R8UEU6_9MICO|nr:DUF6049 family protein [Cryobacterium tagatosivorans]TFB49840.1 hypothetical protein E3O23_10585 [Cryobacterium tagatosivorans]
MEAETSRARRPVHRMIVRSPASRLRMPLSVLIVTLLLSLTGLFGGTFPAASPAHAATPAPDAVSVDVSPTGAPVLRPGQPLPVTVRITNGTADTVPVGTIKLYLATRALTSRTALGNWLRPEKLGAPGDLMLSQPTTAAIQPGGTAIYKLSVPAPSIGLGAANAWGARGMAATLTGDGDVLAQGRGTFVWYSGEPVTPVKLAVAMPITTPASSAGLIPAEELEAYTQPSGLLTRQLDGVIDRPVAIAIDPMIIASIRILGSSAPPGATVWLSRLAEATNDIFPLGYADADIALQAQAGSKTALAPISFEWLIDPELFTEAPPTPEPTAGTAPPTPGESATPSPSPTPGELTPPTSAGLLDWDYTMTDIGWPAAGVVAKGDLDVFAASGLTTTILSGSNVTQSTDATDEPTPNTVLSLGSGRGLATDDAISRALRDAARATTEDAWRGAVAEASSQLAVVSAERPGTARTLLATFDRGRQANPDRLVQTLDSLSALPWQTPATLREARSAPQAVGVAFEPQAETDARVDLARRLLRREAEVGAFSTALEDPVRVTGAHRLELLALLGTAWADDPAAWREATDASFVASADLLRSVTVTTKGPVNVVGSKVDIPVTLSNSLGQAVTVSVQVVPSNGRLVVGNDVEATIDADSARTVKVPVTAAVGNGDVTLRVSLYTPDGTRIDRPTEIAVSVHADWEGLGALIFAVIVVLFFGFGVWRNILRRRRERAALEAEESGESGAGESEAEADTAVGATAATEAGSESGPGSGPGSGTGTGSDDVRTPATDPRG